ncbi:MAG: repressor LexA [Lachnospiraceae bacterium]|nr:repressor LexA [Lachnospiraceae bacterium]
MQRKRTTSDRAKDIEKYLNDYSSAYGTAPSMQEIADALGLGKTTVFYHLKKMEEAGRIESRGHRGVYTARQLADRGPFVPILGSVACGQPLFAEENVEDYVRLPESLFGRGEFFFLRARGISMIEAGIDNGDLVLFRRQETAWPGELVLALTKNKTESTLKRYYPEPETGQVRLHPENPKLKGIYFPIDDFAIQGVAVKVIKDIK